MADINSVILVGRLTRNAQIAYTNSGMAISKFSLAINKRRKVNDEWKEEVNYFDCVLFGKTAEALDQYLKKGKQIAVSGELRQNRWEQAGQKRSKIEILVITVQLLGGDKKPAQVQNDIAQGQDDDIPF